MYDRSITLVWYVIINKFYVTLWPYLFFRIIDHFLYSSLQIWNVTEPPSCFRMFIMWKGVSCKIFIPWLSWGYEFNIEVCGSYFQHYSQFLKTEKFLLIWRLSSDLKLKAWSSNICNVSWKLTSWDMKNKINNFADLKIKIKVQLQLIWR